MAFQGFKNAPGPCRPPTTKIYFGSPPPSAAAESLFQSKTPPQQQPSAFLFSPADTLTSSFPLIFSFGNTSRDIPAKDDKQHTELKN